MKIKFNIKSDIDLIVLEAGINDKMKKVIMHSLKACIKMEPYIIPYSLACVDWNFYKRARIYNIILSPVEDADIIDMLDNALDIGRLVKFLLRCYAFGKGVPDYKLINLAYMRAPYFEENFIIEPVHDHMETEDADTELTTNDNSLQGLLNLIRSEVM